MLADQRHEHRSLAEIAFAVGFNVASSFARAFRDEFHVAPRAYRVACADPGEPSAPRR